MTYRAEFTIPMKLDGMNEYQNACRSGYQIGARMKKENMEAVQWAIRMAKLKRVPEEQLPINILYHWVEPNRKRDKDNIRAASKFILDALVQEGILPGDGWRQVGDIQDIFSVDKNRPRIVVTLWKD